MADVALDELEGRGSLPERLPRIVLIDTGWAAQFGTERALQHPALTEEAFHEVQRRGMRVLTVDTLSPDLTRAADASFRVHEAVLGAGGLIIAKVRGPEALPARVPVGFFPLRLADDGAPVRAETTAQARR